MYYRVFALPKKLTIIFQYLIDDLEMALSRASLCEYSPCNVLSKREHVFLVPHRALFLGVDGKDFGSVDHARSGALGDQSNAEVVGNVLAPKDLHPDVVPVRFNIQLFTISPEFLSFACQQPRKCSIWQQKLSKKVQDFQRYIGQYWYL